MKFVYLIYSIYMYNIIYTLGQYKYADLLLIDNRHSPNKL